MILAVLVAPLCVWGPGSPLGPSGIQPVRLQSDSKPMLMRHPSLSRSQIAFAFAGDIWTVPRQGGAATRITSSPGVESNPFFSPDGSMIAFSGQYEGNTDVYVVPATGGVPKRLTYHPAPEVPVGWTPDGLNIVFASNMNSENGIPRLYEVSVSGGTPKALPFPCGAQASFASDGSKIAYAPDVQWQAAWKRYRGGQTTPIWIGNLADSKVTEIPRRNSNDREPMWVGDKIYFLSDRDGYFSIYSYDTKAKSVKRILKNDGLDIKSASASGDTIAYERLGSINLLDAKTGDSHEVPIEINADFPEVRTRYKSVGDHIDAGALSPSGSRAVFEARGDIFTAPASKGEVRNLTASSGVFERDPAWSPDGKSICYFSDASGEYKLVIKPANGIGAERSITLGNAPAFYYNPVWSPDSKKIAYRDNHHVIWILDVDKEKNIQVDERPYENPVDNDSPSWSPDSKWLAYNRELDNHLNSVFVFSIESGKSTRITDGLSEARFPIFDANGKYLYFVASTNTAAGAAWLNLSTYSWLNQLSNVYVTVLRSDLPSPLEPESDEEKAESKPADKKPGGPDKFRIDFEGISQRILALPMPASNYQGLLAGSDGVFFAAILNPVSYVTSPPTTRLVKYNAADRSVTPFLANFSSASLNSSGDKMLVQLGSSWSIVPTAAAPAPGQGGLDLSGMVAKIDPKSEWRQMYHEVWRIERDFLYDPHHHGQNLTALEAKYAPYLEGICSRDDLNYLFTDMLGELTIGHMFIRGGDVPSVRGAAVGLLGADYQVENDRYRFAKVFSGENWNPEVRAPLTQPGVNVRPGEYLLAVNGQDLTAKENLFAAFEGTATKQTKIKVGPNPDGTGSREVTVVPVAEDQSLRHLAWVEECRRKVAELSGGKVGYVHVPDTNIGGWVSFNRYYFSQIDREGMVVDERFNGGGQVDDYFVEMMSRPLMSMWTSRYGKDFASPLSTVFGPKALIVNQYAGSGGDYFPWHFRKAGVGPIVGKRTWGGLVGILVFPTLMDGGQVTAPNIAFYNPNGTWDVENHGVDPDIEVGVDPYLWRQGHDAQLERAVEVVLKRIAAEPKPTIKKPTYVDKSKIQ